MEAVDMIIITKADHDLVPAAQLTQSHYLSALQFIHPKYPVSSALNWSPPIYISSIITKLNLKEIEEQICLFHKKLCETGYIDVKRSEQRVYWLQQKLIRLLLLQLQNNKNVQLLQKEIELKVRMDEITPAKGAQILLQEFMNSINNRPQK
jgi:LAO/AO transport system kinase